MVGIGKSELGGLHEVISGVSKEKNLDSTIIVDALEQAVIHAARKSLGISADLEAHYNEDIGEVELFQFRTVVNEIGEHPEQEIVFDEARKLDPESELGDSIGTKIETQEFGRIAAQSAKQIIVQKVRDAERAKIYDENKEKVGEILSGYVRRVERNNIIVDLDGTEAIITYKEQVPTERYHPNDRVSGYVMEVKRASRGPQVILSRAHPGFLVRLFEQTVTEIYDGIVSIESASRDAGFRSKIAVRSNDHSVDPVGACVGMKGARVQSIVSELNGEKIDIVPWDEDPARFVCNALAPAEVSKLIVDENTHSMEVIVAEDQLSLAIGKRGQNVRLAAQLTGWKLDIKSESKVEEQYAGAKEQLATIEGLGAMSAEILFHEGFSTVADVANLTPRILSRLLNMDSDEGQAVIDAAKKLASELGEDLEHAAMLQNSSAAPEKPTEDKPKRYDREAGKAASIEAFSKLKGVGEAAIHALADGGYKTIGDVIADSVEELSDRTELPMGIARTVQLAAERYMQDQLSDD